MTSFPDVHVKQARSLFCVVVLVLGLCSQLEAATPPPAFIEKSVATGLLRPTAMAFAPDGRLFVCQQGGALRVIQNDVLLTTAFMTLTVDSSGERGLLGIAFDPSFMTNNYLYVYYTVPGTSAHNRISRFTANGNVVVAGSELVILDLNNLSTATNHNGGAIHFGPDGKLYADVGENANAANAQSFSNLLGKTLRINSDGTIPTDNPYFNDPNVTGNNKLIWSLGLRNPFTFAFQPGTGRMFINDVGQNTWEEINEGVAHSNYGWSICEGFSCSGSPPTDYRAPLYVYNHTTGTPTGCAIVGAAFYNPQGVQYPASYVGKYFFADLCGGYIRYIDPNAGPPIPSSTPFATGISSPVDLQVSSNGSLYYLAQGSGSNTGVVSKFIFPSNSEKNFDFDGDGKADISVWRPDQSIWYILRSSDNSLYFPQWGQTTDKLVPADFDGDGKTDVAVWRPADGYWYINGSTNGFSAQQWGLNGDTPVAGDYDGDSRADLAVVRPSTFTWYLQRTTSGFQAQQWGTTGDTLVPGDYNGDGKTDIAVWRPSDGFWYIRNSDGTSRFQQWGISEDKPVPGDYDNDGMIDLAVWRPSSGTWYVLRSSDSQFIARQWGESTDVPAAADYDGDGKTDIAVWRPSTGIFWIYRSSDAAVVAQQWGGASFNDVPVPSVNAR